MRGNSQKYFSDNEPVSYFLFYFLSSSVVRYSTLRLEKHKMPPGDFL